MALVPSLLLLSALLFVVEAQDQVQDQVQYQVQDRTQDPHSSLSSGFRAGVDLALDQLSSSSVPHHYRLFWTMEKSEMDAGSGAQYLYHHFRLKATRCAKGTTASNGLRCPFRNDRPLMDCVTCYKTSPDQIERTPEPYTHCLQKPRVTQEVTTTRKDHCKKMVYNPGASSLIMRG